MYVDSGGLLKFDDITGAVTPLSLSATGAAITGTLSTTGTITGNIDNGYVLLNRSVTSYYVGVNFRTANVEKWFTGLRENLTSNNYVIYNAATGHDVLTLNTSTDAASFYGAISDAAGDVRLIPQNSQSAAYTTVLADSGKHIFHPSADTTARTFTIPANGTVAYTIGTAITFINQNGAGVVTIAITTDTMRLANSGATGSRTLAANGVATAVKITSTEWIISGTGLT